MCNYTINEASKMFANLNAVAEISGNSVFSVNAVVKDLTGYDLLDMLDMEEYVSEESCEDCCADEGCGNCEDCEEKDYIKNKKIKVDKKANKKLTKH